MCFRCKLSPRANFKCNVILRPYCVAWHPQLADQTIKYICIKIKVVNHICAFVVNYLILRHFFVQRDPEALLRRVVPSARGSEYKVYLY